MNEPLFGECGKHPGHNMVDCSACAVENMLDIAKIVDRHGAEIPARQVHTNTMGHMRLPINAKHEELITKIRDTALELYVLLHDAGGTDPNQDRFANRNLAIAATDLEAVVMRAIRGVCDRK